LFFGFDLDSLFRGLLALSKAVSFGGPGMTIREMSEYPYQLDQTLGFLVVMWAILMVLALYLEAVVPIGPGIKKHPLFFIPKVIHLFIFTLTLSLFVIDDE
jgi:hypothetical protein